MHLTKGRKEGKKSPWAKLEKSVLNHMIENLEKLTVISTMLTSKHKLLNYNLKLQKDKTPKTGPLSKKSCEQNLTVE